MYQIATLMAQGNEYWSVIDCFWNRIFKFAHCMFLTCLGNSNFDKNGNW